MCLDSCYGSSAYSGSWEATFFRPESGLLTVYLAFTGFQRRLRGAAMAVAVAGAGSIGLMASVNFILNSDFKWHLLALALFWVAALVLYSVEKSVEQS